MNKIALSIATLFFMAVSVAAQNQVDSTSTSLTHRDSLTLGYLQRISQHTASCYKLYPTDNMWTFLELETFSGRIWQVQFSIKGATIASSQS